MSRDISSIRTAHAASAWARLFGALHVVWALAYFYWPGFGRVTLGADFEVAFGRPWFMVYDLVVAVLFVLAGTLALSVVRPWGTSIHRWILVAGLWTAAALLGLRGAAGVVADLLVVLGVVGGTLTRWVFYDFWFLLGGMLFGALAWRTRSRPASVCTNRHAD